MKALFERCALLIILLVASANSFPQENTDQFDPLKGFISLKYEAGPALVYDCFDMHWVCTGKFEHGICQERRVGNIERGKIELSCMADKVFETINECNRYLKQIIVRGNVPRGCLHPEHKKRFIGFR